MKNNNDSSDDNSATSPIGYGTLCRTFKPGESILIGDVLLTVDKVVGKLGGARLIIRAKKDIKITRLENASLQSAQK